MKLKEVLLRVWLDRGGEHVDARAEKRERELRELERRTRRLEQMVEVKRGGAGR